MKDSFTTVKICQHLGCTERQLIHWVHKGFVTPAVDAEGTGTRRQYTAKNVFEIGIIETLWGKVGNQTIKRVLEWLSVYKNKPEEVQYMIITGEDVHPVRKESIARIKKQSPGDKPGELLPGTLSGLVRSVPMEAFELPALSILSDAITNNEVAVVLNVGMVRKKVEGLIVS